MHIKNTTLIISAIFLASCASTFSNLTSIKKLKVNSIKDGESIVIFSTGAPKACLVSSIDIQLLNQDKKLDSLNKPYVVAGFLAPNVARSLRGPVFTGTNYQIKPDFETHHGYLHAKRIKAGEYYFYPYSAVLDFPNTPKANFSVKANETVYLGEYFLTPTCKINKFPKGGIFVNNKFDRDMNKAQELNPNIDYFNVVQRIMTLEGGHDAYKQDSPP